MKSIEYEKSYGELILLRFGKNKGFYEVVVVVDKKKYVILLGYIKIPVILIDIESYLLSKGYKQNEKILLRIKGANISYRFVRKSIIDVKQTAVVISPHPDDAELNCFSIIKNQRPIVYVITDGSESPDYYKSVVCRGSTINMLNIFKKISSKAFLDNYNVEYNICEISPDCLRDRQGYENDEKIKKFIAELRRDVLNRNIKVLVIPHPKYDIHPDHKAILGLIEYAFRDDPGVMESLIFMCYTTHSENGIRTPVPYDPCVIAYNGCDVIMTYALDENGMSEKLAFLENHIAIRGTKIETIIKNRLTPLISYGMKKIYKCIYNYIRYHHSGYDSYYGGFVKTSEMYVVARYREIKEG